MGNEHIISRVTDSLDSLRDRMKAIKAQHVELSHRKRSSRPDDEATRARLRAAERHSGVARLSASYGGPRPL